MTAVQLLGVVFIALGAFLVGVAVGLPKRRRPLPPLRRSHGHLWVVKDWKDK